MDSEGRIVEVVLGTEFLTKTDERAIIKLALKTGTGSSHGKSVQAPIRFVILHSVYDSRLTLFLLPLNTHYFVKEKMFYSFIRLSRDSHHSKFSYPRQGVIQNLISTSPSPRAVTTQRGRRDV